jgi:hypothetical protein
VAARTCNPSRIRRQEDYEFEASPSKASPYLKNKIKRKGMEAMFKWI